MSFQNLKYVTNSKNELPKINPLTLHNSITNILAETLRLVTPCILIGGYQRFGDMHTTSPPPPALIPKMECLRKAHRHITLHGVIAL
jgi:hypothetical protein